MQATSTRASRSTRPWTGGRSTTATAPAANSGRSTTRSPTETCLPGSSSSSNRNNNSNSSNSNSNSKSLLQAERASCRKCRASTRRCRRFRPDKVFSKWHRRPTPSTLHRRSAGHFARQARSKISQEQAKWSSSVFFTVLCLPLSPPSPLQTLPVSIATSHCLHAVLFPPFSRRVDQHCRWRGGHQPIRDVPPARHARGEQAAPAKLPDHAEPGRTTAAAATATAHADRPQHAIQTAAADHERKRIHNSDWRTKFSRISRVQFPTRQTSEECVQLLDAAPAERQYEEVPIRWQRSFQANYVVDVVHTHSRTVYLLSTCLMIIAGVPARFAH